MASGSHSVARFLLPVFMAVTVVSLGILLFRPKPTPAQATPDTSTAQPAATSPGPIGSQAAAGQTPATSGLTGLTAKPQPLTGPWSTLGSLDGQEKDGPLMRVTFNPAGAGLLALELRDHHQATDPKSPHEVLQQTQGHAVGGVVRSLVPFAMLQAEINGQRVPLTGEFLDPSGAVVASDWAERSPGVFVAEIVDGAGSPVARITRAFQLHNGRYEIILLQNIENLSNTPLTVRLLQLGPVELPVGTIRYGGDPRRLRIGHMAGPGAPVEGRSPVYARTELLGTPIYRASQWDWSDHIAWPTPDSKTAGERLSWIGQANRFFAVTAHTLSPDKEFREWETVDRVVLTRQLDSDGRPETGAAMALRASSPVMTIEPGQTGQSNFGIYAGPVDREPLKLADKASDKGAGPIKLTDLEIYFFPGPCSFCTFQFLAHFLRSVLSFFSTYVVFDHALAIILLVVCVRTVLHPITKWSQMSLQRFGKQMQRVAPKQKALQEKFKDDPARMRQEMAAMMREENVNYFGALGCLPMFLQTPVWIALSSLMFFLFDLRHAPAFFGFFQTIGGASWSFLADLSEPDRVVAFSKGITVPLMGEVDSINILPVVLGVVFFLQQKYLTPPSATTLSPEMEMQQKIMKFVIVFLFPLMMYNAPSGLALYFLTNSTLGIVESRLIRKKFDREEAAREEILKRDPHAFRRKPGEEGFFARMQNRFAEAQKRAQALQAQRKNEKGR